MTVTHSGMTPKAIEELISQRVAKALAAQEANRNDRLVVESQSQNEDDDDNGNRGMEIMVTIIGMEIKMGEIETIGIDEAYEMLWKCESQSLMDLSP
nr:hypothetical protein [Tanacetum cinerariifolium]